jgi:hypothetical protein
MALVEIELTQNTFENAVWLLVSSSPIPAPSFAILDPTRLLSSLQWQGPRIVPSAPAFVTPSGALVARADVGVTHVSIDELEANAAAPGTTTRLTAWLLLRVSPAGLNVSLIRLEGEGRTPTQLTPLLPIGFQQIKLAGLEDVRAAAMILDSETVTIRYAAGGNDNLLLPPANRVREDSDLDWLIRVSGEYFSDQVLRPLQKALNPPPSGSKVEEPAHAAWLILDLINLSWGALGTAGIEKKDACADVDLSVEIKAGLSIATQVNANGLGGKMNLTLNVSGDASDWDTFRCWLTTGALAGIVAALATGIVGALVVGIVSLIVIAEFVRTGVGEEVAGTDVGGKFTKVSSDDTSATYTASMDLPVLPGGKILDARVGSEGLVIQGTVTYAAVSHSVSFVPNGTTLPGAWHGSYHCAEHRWLKSYEVMSVVVTDTVSLGTRTGYVAVAIFPTSTFHRVGGPIKATPGYWTIDAPSYPIGSPIVTPRRTVPPTPIEEMKFFLHTSAGIRRYDIGPAGPAPASPSQLDLSIREVSCHVRTREWTKLQQLMWLVDGPPSHYGTPPLRQWMLTFRDLPAVSKVRIEQVGGQRPIRLLERNFAGARSGVIELVTDRNTELMIEHNLGESDAEVRVSQRWLLPTLTLALPGSAENLASVPLPGAESQRVAIVTAGGRQLRIGPGGFVDAGHCVPYGDECDSGRVLSVSMPNGEVVAAWGNQVIVAVPWGLRRLPRLIALERDQYSVKSDLPCDSLEAGIE